MNALPNEARRPGLGGDISGAFADTAVLFPLLLALAWQTGASAALMLATTGVAYWVTGWLFRLPIPVQPLKSLAIVAIATGASALELQAAGLALGAIYLALAALRRLDRLAALVPDVLIHGFQLGLGVLLTITALQLIGGAPVELALVAAAAAAVVLLTRLTGWPLLGGIAVAALIWGLWHAQPLPSSTAGDTLRTSVIAMLVLPQIALTLTNSVLGTERAARDYYGPAAARVTPRRLLGSLGVGNLLVGAIGGMPYCHGSGGVTAHYRGGARSWRANAVIGSALLAMALALVAGGGGLPAMPPSLQALLLLVIGVFHLQLAAPSWRRRSRRAVLLVMGGAALVFQSMLAVLVAGCLALAARSLVRRRLGEAPLTPDSTSSEISR